VKNAIVITLTALLSSCATIGKMNSDLNIRNAQDYAKRDRMAFIDLIYKTSMNKNGWDSKTATVTQKAWLECYSVHIVDYLADVDTALLVEMTGGDKDLMQKVARSFAYKACENPDKEKSRDPAFALKKRPKATIITETNTYNQEDLQSQQLLNNQFLNLCIHYISIYIEASVESIAENFRFI